VIEIVGKEFDVPLLKSGNADLQYVGKVLRGLETA
jgi:hypothetical protein